MVFHFSHVISHQKAATSVARFHGSWLQMLEPSVGNINMSWGGNNLEGVTNSPPQNSRQLGHFGLKAFKTLLDWIFVKKTVMVTGYNFYGEVSCEIVQ